MRFNSKELAYVATHSTTIDKEGVLRMKDKQDGLFKKGETYQERYFRLKGNLLFYFKNKENRSEPLGVVILERCTVELDLKDDVSNSFLLVYEGEDHPYYFACSSEEERDSWIQALHIASYECLNMQLQSLREQLQAKTGRDPIQLPSHQHATLDYESQGDPNEEAVLEISLSCSDLPTDSSGQPPNPLVVVHTMTPPLQQLWVKHNHTEVVEKCYNPQFLRTIGFGGSEGVETGTRVRLTVYHVVERMTGTMSQLGQTVFSLQDVLMATKMSLTQNLQTNEMKDGGKITVMAWINDDNTSLVDIQREKGSDGAAAENLRSRPKSLSRHKDILKTYFDNVISKTFRFATNNDSHVLQVQENMAESKWTLDIPAKLLKLWIDEEKQRISLLQDLGELSTEWGNVRQEMTDFCMSVVTTYTQNISYLTAYTGPSFKPSCEKDNKELEFIPVNLHVQRMTVASEGSDHGKVYDVLTHGAFTAFCQKFKNGGLRKLLQYQKDFYSSQSTLGFRTKMQQACSLLNEIAKLKTDINHGCERLCHAALQGTDTLLQTEMQSLTEIVRELVRLCEDPILQLSAEKYMQAKSPSNTGDGLDLAASLGHMSNDGRNQGDRSPEKSWRWSGSNFVRSPTVEPWEVTRLNLEAAIVCLVSKVDELVTNMSSSGQTTSWLSELSPAVIKLQSFVEIVSSRATLFLTFLSLMENKDHVKLMHMIKNRRDVVTAHAITTLVSGLAVNIQTNCKDVKYLQQLINHGVMAQFESLLSCYGEELAMLEDMTVAVEDLASVTFCFVEAKDDVYEAVLSLQNSIKGGMFPDINRHCIHVEIPVPPQTYNNLPPKLKQGNHIKVVPVIFSIGINEQATLAEKFGNTTLQERVNAESVAKVFNYFEKYVDDFGKAGEPQTSVSQLTKQLHTNVMTKKSKNVEVLHLAAEVCRKLKGVRFACCKSGKDRTSMSVTLEQVQVLQQQHDLASHVFWQSLDCFRSVGCRRDNTHKNTGVRKYAFNSLQMLYVPKLYRAPNGTYGNIQT
ncbi:inositol polyphosphate-4-phosphatase type I A-like isoform X1 [Haliotis rufescens]|uniref:inositol polyphosphate-4-phosphatase type I A-like isoform X1 n=1 Tax=Haliotis rufescens TaxID=6454 RepID=UPI00201EE959|nr:inositol polyphosphate-4-phosphatase type I A-like isoform X1 [Haliotis rufescens]